MLLPIIKTLYLVALTGMSVYGMLGLVTLVYFWQHRRDEFPLPKMPASTPLPSITVQLPIYNEKLVVERLINAAVQLDYPRDCMQIQVVDDSDDETSEIAGNLVTHYKKEGINIEYHHRTHRHGYKAGALQNALTHATGDTIAIFDADFQPNPDFLWQTIPHLQANPKLGMIQARWGHLNPDESALTAAQAIAIDKHFAVDQSVRHRANLFPKFNGSGGVWRRTCLESAGAWQHDTVTEDLCLSTRAILQGWSFRFLDNVVAPAELPTTISAFKNQQARWAKGSTQCLLKFTPEILRNPHQSWAARWYAIFSMAGYLTQLMLIFVVLLLVPLIYWQVQFSPWMIGFSLAGIGHPLLFLLSQHLLYANWSKKLRHFPTLLLIGIGIAPSNARAVLQAFFSKRHTFVRTPKGVGGYKLPLDWIVVAEVLMTIYAGIGLTIALNQQNYGYLPFLTFCTAGFGYVAYLSLRELFDRQ